MELSGVRDVRRVVAAGDTIVDLDAARNAGAIAVGVLTGALGRAQLESHPHDYIIDSVSDLPALLDELERPSQQVEPARQPAQTSRTK
jgi:phosphoglycolate phosphatase-like HAD superfamily hydrolase